MDSVNSAASGGSGVLFIGAVIFWLAFFLLGIYVAREKGRPIEEGMVLAVIFGPFGVLITALLPTIRDTKPAP
jgi:hypothetical protein